MFSYKGSSSTEAARALDADSVELQFRSEICLNAYLVLFVIAVNNSSDVVICLHYHHHQHFHRHDQCHHPAIIIATPS